jgi:peptide/nickel transport system substrate-binding protein
MFSIRRTAATLTLLLMVAGPLALAGCSSSSDSSSDASADSSVTTSEPVLSQDTTLRLAMARPDQALDPATFYGGAAFSLMGAIYQGLVKYVPDSTDIEGDLAESWTVSDDGLTYTFVLRPGQVFHDGSPVTAAAMKSSFERTIRIDGAPSYMLSTVASMDAPDDATFVVTLTEPTTPFLDYLASYVGPKALNPAVLAANAGTDDAASYLATHDAGSGPYELVVADAERYELRAAASYAGEKPFFQDVLVSIIANPETQVLQFENGDIDMLTRDIPAASVARLAEDDKYQVVTYGAEYQSVMFINPDSELLGTPEARAAFAAAIDRQTIVTGAFGQTGKVATNFYPYDQLPDGMAPVPVELDTSAFEDLVEAADSPTLTIGNAGIGPAALATELLQAQLEALGVKTELKNYSAAEFYTLPSNPENRPDVTMLTINADASDPNTWVRPYIVTGASLNILGGSVPAADALIDQGRSETDPAQADEYYAEAGTLYLDQFVPIVDVQGTVIAQRSIADIVTDAANPFGVVIQDLKRWEQ